MYKTKINKIYKNIEQFWTYFSFQLQDLNKASTHEFRSQWATTSTSSNLCHTNFC